LERNDNLFSLRSLEPQVWIQYRLDTVFVRHYSFSILPKIDTTYNFDIDSYYFQYERFLFIMGRNSKQQHYQNRDTQHVANELLNFHFSTPAASRQDVPNSRHSGGSNSSNNNNNHRNAHHGNGNRRRSAQDRSSARRKADATMFYLHSSAEHSFLLTRRSPSKMNETSYSFHGSNESVSWESVRTVQHRVTQCHAHNNATESSFDCPICLCDFVCPRISKCGHSFCLSCILRHVQTYAVDNPYHPVKCPCCGIPFIVEDLRPVIMESIRPIVLQQPLRLRKLHRQKESSAPFLPLPDAPQHSNPHFAPTAEIDADAKYSRFKYVDPDLYHASLEANQEELTHEIKVAASAVGDRDSTVERIYLSMAMEIVLKELHRAKEESAEERKLIARFASSNTGMYQPQSPALLFEGQNVDSGIHSNFSSHDGNQSSHGNDDSKTVSSTIATHQQRYRGDSIGSHTSIDTASTPCTSYERDVDEGINANGNSNSPTRRKHRKKIQGSMYLDTLNAVHFYQAENGQLVFLNGFNMTCLLSDFSKAPPAPVHDEKVEDNAEQNDRKQQEEINRTIQAPLPDFIEGRVLEIENVHLTPESRKRMPFLNHIPLYTDIVFVEVDLNHMLSEVTRRKFKADIAKRRKRRQSKIQTEKRADRVIQKEEQQRINERKARLQTVDPNDEFFQLSSAVSEPTELQSIIDTIQDFGPALLSANSRIDQEVDIANEINDASNRENSSSQPSSTSIPTSSFSFSQAARRGNDHVTLSSAEAFPALSSSSAFPSLGSTRSQPSSGSYLAPKPQNEENQPIVKKKKKGKKLVLFSTGGARGY
jgi:hypothetical protein